MGMGSTGFHQGRSSINVTPPIDVLLVLLIIFMVIQPVAVRGLDALVPHPPSSPNALPDPHTILVQLSQAPDGRLVYRINGQPVEPASLVPTLDNIFAVHADRTIFVQADAALDYQPVLHVINAAHAAGIQNIGLITPQTLIGQ